MKRLGTIFAMLIFAFVLLMGAAGGAMAHVDAHGGAMDHGSNPMPSPSAPSHRESHKAALVVVAPCCPAVEAPTGHAIAVSVTTVEMFWHPQPDYVPNARDITPDTPPPKSSL